MAPKKDGKGAAGLTAAAKEALSERLRLKERAIDNGMLSEQMLPSTQSLAPCKALLKSNGKDIVKKSSNRKNRYMLVFNFQLAPAAAGRLVSPLLRLLIGLKWELRHGYLSATTSVSA